MVSPTVAVACNHFVECEELGIRAFHYDSEAAHERLLAEVERGRAPFLVFLCPERATSSAIIEEAAPGKMPAMDICSACGLYRYQHHHADGPDCPFVQLVMGKKRQREGE